MCSYRQAYAPAESELEFGMRLLLHSITLGPVCNDECAYGRVRQHREGLLMARHVDLASPRTGNYVDWSQKKEGTARM